jgi:hypothetical protein
MKDLKIFLSNEASIDFEIIDRLEIYEIQELITTIQHTFGKKKLRKLNELLTALI